MTAIQCPQCGWGFVVNKRGTCRCGARLVCIELYRPGRQVAIADPDKTWLLLNGHWVPYTKVVWA